MDLQSSRKKIVFLINGSGSLGYLYRKYEISSYFPAYIKINSGLIVDLKYKTQNMLPEYNIEKHLHDLAVVLNIKKYIKIKNHFRSTDTNYKVKSQVAKRRKYFNSYNKKEELRSQI